jgi:hypothetical protein
MRNKDKTMSEPIALKAIEARVVDDHVVIPHGMTPIYLHSLNSQMIAHVAGWTAAREYDLNRYDLYPLANARHFIVSLKSNGEQINQNWYDSFGEATKEAMEDGSGELVIRERVR